MVILGYWEEVKFPDVCMPYVSGTFTNNFQLLKKYDILKVLKLIRHFRIFKGYILQF